MPLWSRGFACFAARGILPEPAVEVSMPRTYSVTEGARLLGVSTATLSRRLPPGRAGRGRSARLSLQELMEVARKVAVDPEVVHRRATLDDQLGPDMPSRARRWVELAIERDLVRALAAHVARIPDDLLYREMEPPADFPMPQPWGDQTKWTPVRSKEELDTLLPPAER